MSSPSAEVKVEAVGAESTSGLSSPPNVSIISIGGEVRPSAVDFYKGIMEPMKNIEISDSTYSLAFNYDPATSSEVQYYISEKLKEALDAHGVDIKDVLNVLIDVHQNSQIELDGAAAQPPINTIEQFAHFVYERQAHAQHISLYRAYDERHELETALAEETLQAQDSRMLNSGDQMDLAADGGFGSGSPGEPSES